MRFGRIDRFIIFGGGERVVNFINVLKLCRLDKITVLSAERQLNARLDSCGKLLREDLEDKKIPYREIEDINRFDLWDLVDKKTLGVSFGAPWIFSAKTIKKFNGRLINGHGMNLPRNRGGGGFSWQIMRGERQGCHLFHLIDEGIDTGSIILDEKFLFPTRCRIPKEYQEFYEHREIAFFKKFIHKVKTNSAFKEVSQGEGESTYFPRLSTSDHGFINWDWPVRAIERFVAAFDAPYAGASTFLSGQRVFLRGARVYSKDGHFHPFMNGLVYRKFHGRLFIAASDGALMIDGVYDTNGASVLDDIKTGFRFVTPRDFLDNALSFRAVYTAHGLKKAASGRGAGKRSSHGFEE